MFVIYDNLLWWNTEHKHKWEQAEREASSIGCCVFVYMQPPARTARCISQVYFSFSAMTSSIVCLLLKKRTHASAASWWHWSSSVFFNCFEVPFEQTASVWSYNLSKCPCCAFLYSNIKNRLNQSSRLWSPFLKSVKSWKSSMCTRRNSLDWLDLDQLM